MPEQKETIVRRKVERDSDRKKKRDKILEDIGSRILSSSKRDRGTII